jgi:hypothetical protein
MVVPSSLRTLNAKVDRWFHDHVVIWWLVLATIPGGAYAGGQMLFNDASGFQAVVLGAVFGTIFATFTVVIQRWRRS